jgi:hypothetical protein
MADFQTIKHQFNGLGDPEESFILLPHSSQHGTRSIQEHP